MSGKRRYYAYVPDKDDREPMGTLHRSLFMASSDQHAIAMAARRHGRRFRLYRYTSFFDDKTHKLVHEQKGVRE